MFLGTSTFDYNKVIASAISWNQNVCLFYSSVTIG